MKIFDILKGVAECTTEILFELFSKENTFGNSNNTSTYDYWMSLDYKEQFEYFQTNEYLKDYMQYSYYSCKTTLFLPPSFALYNASSADFTISAALFNVG